MSVQLNCMTDTLDTEKFEEVPHYMINEVFDFCRKKNGWTFDSRAAIVDRCVSRLSAENKQLYAHDSAVSTCLRQLADEGVITMLKRE